MIMIIKDIILLKNIYYIHNNQNKIIPTESNP